MTIRLLVPILLSLSCACAQIYVSPSGDDRNTGAQNSPVRSLERARDLVRARNQAMTADLTLQLQPGVCYLERPLELDARDSGTGGHNIIYKADSEFAVISGGVRVSGWKLVDRARNL